MTEESLIDERGLYPKYRIVEISNFLDKTRTDLLDGPIKVNGFTLKEVTEPCFVMKFSDPHAQRALLAYADSVEVGGHAKLAIDIRTKVGQAILERMGKRLEEGLMASNEIQDLMDSPQKSEGAHSRACNYVFHKHGTACHKSCPTCHGEQLGA